MAPVALSLRERATRNRTAAEKAARQLVGAQPNSSTIPLAVIPYWEFRLTNLAEGRRRAFRNHLNLMLSHATENRNFTPAEGKDPPMTPQVQELIGRVCAFCEGWCCRGGGNHAYITADTLRRYMAANPHLRPREVLANYLDRLGNRVNYLSCIYHGPKGCGLPADMRSDTCNQYFCTGASRLLAEIGSAAPMELVVAKEADGEVRAMAMMAGDSMWTLTPPLPRGRADGANCR